MGRDTASLARAGHDGTPHAAPRGTGGPAERIANRLVLLWGWRRLLVAALAGALGALAQAPFDLFPVLFVSLTILVWLLDGSGTGIRSAGVAAATGWAFGFGYFLAGLYWIGAAFLVERETFGWLMPFAVIALPAVLAAVWACGTALAWTLWSPGPMRIAALAVALTGAEWVRGHLFTGFPWNSLGQALGGPAILAQNASVFGMYGLTLLAILIFASPAALSGTGRGRAAFPVFGLVLMAGLALHGAWRLAGAAPDFVPDVSLRIVQPNIDQRDKWRPELLGDVVRTYLDLSASESRPGVPGLTGVTHLIWPETALPVLINDAPDVLAAIADAVPDETTLLLGAVRSEAVPDGETRYFNSLYALDGDGGILTRYDKRHLVPFGEYLPLRGLLESIGLEQLARIRGGFAKGRTAEIVSVPGAPPVRPLICYEVIFPGEIVPGARPGWIVNVTNDAWFGETAGPHQHLAQARMRAVEQGLPLVRAANTGISAVIDPYGRVLDRIELSQAGIIDTRLPRALDETVFARHGGWVLLGMMLACLLAALTGRSRRRYMYV